MTFTGVCRAKNDDDVRFLGGCDGLVNVRSIIVVNRNHVVTGWIHAAGSRCATSFALIVVVLARHKTLGA